MELTSNKDNFEQMQDVVMKLKTEIREGLFRSMEINNRAVDFIEVPSPDLLVLAENQEETMIKVTYYLNQFIEMYYE